MRSPLTITYEEVASNPNICLENPLRKNRDLLGNQVLWEGRQNQNDIRSTEFRVVHSLSKGFPFFRFDKRFNEWAPIPKFQPRRFFRKKKEPVPNGRVRIEMYSNGRTVRTVGGKK